MCVGLNALHSTCHVFSNLSVVLFSIQCLIQSFTIHVSVFLYLQWTSVTGGDQGWGQMQDINEKDRTRKQVKTEKRKIHPSLLSFYLLNQMYYLTRWFFCYCYKIHCLTYLNCCISDILIVLGERNWGVLAYCLYSLWVFFCSFLCQEKAYYFQVHLR